MATCATMNDTTSPYCAIRYQADGVYHVGDAWKFFRGEKSAQKYCDRANVANPKNELVVRTPRYMRPGRKGQ